MHSNYRIDLKPHIEREFHQITQEDMEITTIRSFEDIENIRSIWEQMQSSESYLVPNANIDRYLTIMKAGGDDVQPYIMLVGRSDHPATMIIGRIEKHKLKLRIGYKTLLSPELKCLSIVYGGIIGQPSSDVCAEVIRELIKVLHRREADVVFFNHLRNDSPMYKPIRSIPNVLCRDHFPLVDTHWQTPLPDTIDEFFDTLSGKQKRNMRRDIKRLEKQTSGSVKVILYHNVFELDSLIDKISEISSNTYQKALEVGFSNNKLTRSILEQSAVCRWLRGYVLYAGNIPLAYEIGTVYGRVYFADDAGFDARWRSYGPGTILQLKILEELSSDSSVSIYDYGFGDAQYKERYGRISWPETSLYIFAPRFYPIFVNQTKSLISLTSKVIAYFTNKMGMNQSLKRYWRNLLWRKNIRVEDRGKR